MVYCQKRCLLRDCSVCSVFATGHPRAADLVGRDVGCLARWVGQKFARLGLPFNGVPLFSRQNKWGGKL